MVKIRPPPKPTLPEPRPGMALSVAPAAHRYWLDDYEYYDQIGRDPLQQAKLWLIKETDARVAKLKEVIAAYPKQMHRRLMLNTVVERGDEALVRCFIETGMRLHPEFRDAPRPEEEEESIQKAKENEDPLDVDDIFIVPIHTAAAFKHTRCVKLLIEEGKVPVDSRDAYGHTPLMRGADEPELVAYLLEKGADPTLRTNPDTYHEDFVGPYPDVDALEFSAIFANAEVVKMLLDHPTWGIAAEKSSENGGRMVHVTPHCILAAAGQPKGFEALKLLLDRGGYPIRAADGKTKTELLTEAQRKTILEAIRVAVTDGQLESIQLLLSYEHPTDLDGNILPFEIPEELRKPLTWGAYEAIKEDNVPKFEFINGLGVVEHDTMSLDKRPEGQNLNLQHLLDKAAEAGSVNCVRLLVEKYGADPNKHRLPPGMKPLYWAAGNDKPEVVRLLIEKYGADIHLGSGSYATGPTALFAAIAFKSLESVAMLLRYGGPVDYINEEIRSISSPMTAILLAQMDGTKPSVRFEADDEAEKTRIKFDDWKNLNPPYVCLDLVPEDREWIDRLQARRPTEELRETGENARDLDEEEAKKREEEEEGDDDGIDPRILMNSFPAPEPRQSELRSDPDLLPEFKPWLVPV
ncbi:ankyrin repeat PH and SEC7 domain protein [Fusarium beomiforme]|uniref:Ankyrin repeat PH and SEC7 domain protein n=1 Tax=Fusarium beomiforme TaxID=44412 RepID=A0A9P5DUC3_9HYPO|nr:ankyrin repeat PH and SEC7 domain protein [Fusarium beomiforme]